MMKRLVLLLPLVALACGADPMTDAGAADAASEAGSDAALPSLEGVYSGQWSFRARDLAPVADPSPNGGGSNPEAARVTMGRLDLSVFMPRCTVRVLPQSPTSATAEATTCESDPRDPWRGQHVTARVALRPGAMLAVGGGRITGTLEWDFTGTIDRGNPNAGMTQTGVITLTLNLTRAP